MSPTRSTPLVGFSRPMIILNRVVLPAPLGPIADDSAARQIKIEVLEQQLVAERLGTAGPIGHRRRCARRRIEQRDAA